MQLLKVAAGIQSIAHVFCQAMLCGCAFVSPSLDRTEPLSCICWERSQECVSDHRAGKSGLEAHPSTQSSMAHSRNCTILLLLTVPRKVMRKEEEWKPPRSTKPGAQPRHSDSLPTMGRLCLMPHSKSRIESLGSVQHQSAHQHMENLRRGGRKEHLDYCVCCHKEVLHL